MPKTSGGDAESKRKSAEEATEEPQEEPVIRDKRASRKGLGLDDEPEASPPEREEEPTAEEPEESKAAEPPEEPTAEPSTEAPGEPASVYGMLALFFQMLSQQAWVSLGVRADPYTNQLAQNLEEAELAIDTLAYLREKMSARLSPDELRMAEGELSNLRINFVQRRSKPEA
jgi:hypothetical protein